MKDHMSALMNPSLLFSLLLSTSSVYASFAFSYGNLSGGRNDDLEKILSDINEHRKEFKEDFKYDQFTPTDSSSSDSGDSLQNEMNTLSDRLRRMGNFSEHEARAREGYLDDYMEEILGASGLPNGDKRFDVLRLKLAKNASGEYVYDSIQRALLSLHKNGFLNKLLGHQASFAEAESILLDAERSIAYVNPRIPYFPGMAHLAAYLAFTFPQNCDRFLLAFLRQFRNDIITGTFYLERIEDPQNFHKIIDYMCKFDSMAAVDILQSAVEELIILGEPLTCENIILQ